MNIEHYLSRLRLAELPELLDLLANLREQARRCTLDLDAQIATLKQTKCERLGWMVEAEQTLERTIKQQCLAQHLSVKGRESGLQVIFARGRVTWNTAKLDGYAVEHPEIRTFRNVGMSSAKIVEK